MIFGTTIDKKNPEFTSADFTFWCPQFKEYVQTEDGQVAFSNLYTLANDKIFYSIFGADWKLAMSLCIAHYLTLIGQQMQAPSGSTLGEIAGGGVTRGVLSSANIGGFNKTFDLGKTMIDSDDAKFWNLTQYGADLMALLKTKSMASIFVVTNDPRPDPFVTPHDRILPF